MCGIIGCCGNPEQKLLTNLCVESQIRGLHAFGYSFLDNNDELVTTKTLQFEDNFLDNYFSAKTNKFIWHNRYSTSGDWRQIKNNQPITYDKIAIAMNGVISMASKPEFEKKFGVKCESENDTEIFLRLLQKTQDPEKAWNELEGSLALIFIWRNKIFAMRNEYRPLHYFQTSNANYICSTADIARRAGKIKTNLIKPNTLIDVGRI